MGRQRKNVWGVYGCGCEYADVWVQDRPKYCKEHGDGIAHEWNTAEHPSAEQEENTIKYKEEDKDKPKFEGQLFQDVTDTPIEKIILSGIKHYKNKFGIVMGHVLVHREAMKENELIIKSEEYGDIIVRKDGHLGKTYYWFFSEEPPEQTK
jgi:hypothetical protein